MGHGGFVALALHPTLVVKSDTETISHNDVRAVSILVLPE
jgi:hypothetical protein